MTKREVIGYITPAIWGVANTVLKKALRSGLRKILKYKHYLIVSWKYAGYFALSLAHQPILQLA
jgi:hypothetical protein